MDNCADIKSNADAVLKSSKILPWFTALSGDLLFFTAIVSIYLTVVKNLSFAQISFLTTFSSLLYIVCQKFFLEIIKVIGNVYSVRIGVLFLLIASILITFSNSYIFILIGYSFYSLAYLFKTMDCVILKNNLTFLDKDNEYLKYKSKSNLIYSISTTLIALVSGYLFNFNSSLPMYLCVLVCFINVILSFSLCDVGLENNSLDIKKDKSRINFSKIVFYIIICYGLFYAVISNGQSNVSLYIQNQLSNNFSADKMAIYFSYIILFSRISRVIASFIFCSLYDKLNEKINIYLPAVTIFSFCLIIISNFYSSLLLKLALMTFGFCLILAVREIFGIYIEDLLLKETDSYFQQSAISYLGVARKIGEFIISFIITLILLQYDLIMVISFLIILTILSLKVSLIVFKLIINKDDYQNKNHIIV